jgi:hypothetical protein
MRFSQGRIPGQALGKRIIRMAWRGEKADRQVRLPPWQEGGQRFLKIICEK